MGVERQRARDTAAERPLQHEVERAEARQRVAHDLARHDPAKVLLHALRRDVLLEQRIVLRPIGDHRDVECLAFVSGARVSQVSELHDQDSSIWTAVTTCSRFTYAEATASVSRTSLVAPPPPAGPFV